MRYPAIIATRFAITLIFRIRYPGNSGKSHVSPPHLVEGRTYEEGVIMMSGEVSQKMSIQKKLFFLRENIQKSIRDCHESVHTNVNPVSVPRYAGSYDHPLSCPGNLRMLEDRTGRAGPWGDHPRDRCNNPPPGRRPSGGDTSCRPRTSAPHGIYQRPVKPAFRKRGSGSAEDFAL